MKLILKPKDENVLAELCKQMALTNCACPDDYGLENADPCDIHECRMCWDDAIEQAMQEGEEE